jgi:hypothetical protein
MSAVVTQTEKEKEIVRKVASLLKKEGVAHRIAPLSGTDDAIWHHPDDYETVEEAFLRCGAGSRNIESRTESCDRDSWMTVVAYDAEAMMEKLTKAVEKSLKSGRFGKRK